jgi:group I intron endonuclease
MIVYMARNKINGKIYVGMTRRSLAARFSSHKNTGHAFHAALLKYGIQSFEISVIDEAKSWKVLCEKERYWIAFYDCLSPRGYNLTTGGIAKARLSPETRAKIGAANRGNKMPEAHVAKMIEFHTGRKRSAATRLRMSKAARAIKERPWLKHGAGGKFVSQG